MKKSKVYLILVAAFVIMGILCLIYPSEVSSLWIPLMGVWGCLSLFGAWHKNETDQEHALVLEEVQAELTKRKGEFAVLKETFEKQRQALFAQKETLDALSERSASLRKESEERTLAFNELKKAVHEGAQKSPEQGEADR